MAYVSLYRKYRPQTFEDVVGQRHVTQTLVNAIAEDRIHHAYLFTGPRGTGKTSTARILAKALNCAEGPTATPCNDCEMCRQITTGSSVDVIELDMASHGGVDDARELRDRALFAPAMARKKVYILDEVHMASTAAFNALLKLIEEPPGHVVFAMATTDPQKVIPTIMSRVQRLDLRRIGHEDLVAHVERICELEGYTIEPAASAAVVRAGDGSARDTMSVLEQVLSFSGSEVTADKVAQTLGTTPTEVVFATVDRVAARDLAGLLAQVQQLLDQGHDLRRFTFDLLGHLRDLLVLQVAPDHPDLVDATAERRERLAAQSGALSRETLLRAVDLLAATVTEQRQGPARLPLELALARLATPGADGDIADLADRVARLEQRPAGAEAPASTGPARAEVPAPAPTPAEAPTPVTAAADAPPPAPTTAPDEQAGGAGDDDAASAPLGLVERARARADAASAAASAPAEQDDPADPDVPSEPADPGAPDEGDAPLGADPARQADDASSGDGPGPTDTPAPIEGLPPGPVAEVPHVEDRRGHGADDLAAIVERWEAILELVKEDKRRFHAVFEPAEPIALKRGVLTLRYPTRYRSFHAENARKGEYASSLRAAIDRACGIEIKVDVVVDGDARPPAMPPTISPSGPEASEPAGEATDEEQADVREAELADAGAEDPDDLAARAAALVTSELDAQRIAEHRPDDAEG